MKVSTKLTHSLVGSETVLTVAVFAASGRRDVDLSAS